MAMYMCLCQPISWSLAAILCDPIVAVACCAYTPMSNTASHFNHKKSDSWVSRSVRHCLAALCLSSTISNNPGT